MEIIKNNYTSLELSKKLAEAECKIESEYGYMYGNAGCKFNSKNK